MSEEKIIIRPSIRQLAFNLIFRIILFIILCIIAGVLIFDTTALIVEGMEINWPLIRFLIGLGLIFVGTLILILPFREKITLEEGKIEFTVQHGYKTIYKKNNIRSVTPIEHEGSFFYPPTIRLILVDTKQAGLKRYYLLHYSKENAERIIKHLQELI
ncbi:MAG: hypothetical protein ACFFC7_23010 [Candidatus Hermodarchaeota archaeon]